MGVHTVAPAGLYFVGDTDVKVHGRHSARDDAPARVLYVPCGQSVQNCCCESAYVPLAHWTGKFEPCPPAHEFPTVHGVVSVEVWDLPEQKNPGGMYKHHSQVTAFTANWPVGQPRQRS